MSERLRFRLALAGVPLWLAYPFALWFGPLAARQVHCAGREFTGAFDECFNDYLPIAEMAAFPLTLLLLYPFLRFAFALYVPMNRPEGWRWRLAGSSGGADCFPSLQLLTGVAMLWAILHVAALPLAGSTAPFWIYWMAWLVWLALGLRASWPLADGREP